MSLFIINQSDIVVHFLSLWLKFLKIIHGITLFQNVKNLNTILIKKLK